MNYTKAAEPEMPGRHNVRLNRFQPNILGCAVQPITLNWPIISTAAGIKTPEIAEAIIYMIFQFAAFYVQEGNHVSIELHLGRLMLRPGDILFKQNCQLNRYLSPYRSRASPSPSPSPSGDLFEDNRKSPSLGRLPQGTPSALGVNKPVLQIDFGFQQREPDSSFKRTQESYLDKQIYIKRKNLIAKKAGNRNMSTGVKHKEIVGLSPVITK